MGHLYPLSWASSSSEYRMWGRATQLAPPAGSTILPRTPVEMIWTNAIVARTHGVLQE